MGSQETDKTLENYLLGTLSVEERERIERQYLADSDFFDELLAIEDDLMDDYVRGELSAGECRQFEKHLLTTPQQREKLRYARILIERLPAMNSLSAGKEAQPSSERRSWFSFFSERKFIPVLAISCAVLIFTVGGIWLYTRITQLQNQIKHLRAEQVTAEQREQELQTKLAGEQQLKDDLLRQLQQQRESGLKSGEQGKTPDNKQTAPGVITFTLLPTLLRGGSEATTFSIPHDLEVVQLQAQLAEGNYKSYRAELQTADGVVVFNLTGLTARRIANRQSLLLRIPVKLLKKRDYVLKVSGIVGVGNFEDAGFYSFSINRK